MGGAASLLKKKEKEDDREPLPGNDDEWENEEANTKPSRFKNGFANLKKRATSVANKALAKAGLADYVEDSPDEEEEETPQKQRPSAPAEVRI